MTRFYRPEPARPVWRDALAHWREGLPMLSVLPILWIFALTLEACCG